jgi:outer membrane protein OmpA-like peptidoglycan-associated protein
MKKILILSFILISTITIAQNNDLAVYFGCYANNDSLSMLVVKKTDHIHVLDNAAGSATIKNWEMDIYLKKGKIIKCKAGHSSSFITRQMKDELLGGWKKIDKVVVQDVEVSAFNKKTNKYEDQTINPVTFYLNDKTFKKCDEKNTEAQDDLILKFSCFKTADTATIKEILHYPTLTTINSNSQVDVKVVSYNYVIPKMDNRRNPQGISTIANTGLGLNDQSFDFAKKLLPGEPFVLNDIVVEFFNRKSKVSQTITVAPIVIMVGKRSNSECGDVGSDSLFVLEYSGKLLTGKDKNQPLINQKVLLKDNKDTIIQTTVTNSYGDFTFKNLTAKDSYKINVPLDEKSKIKDQQLYLAKVDGTIVKSLDKSGNTFVYQVLPAELNILAREKEEDTELKIKNFGLSNKSELTVIENIYYAPNSSEIDDASMVNIDKIISAMKQNPALKLFISSHTDSKGEDAYNMMLSEKRAKNVLNYFLSKGIAASRLTAKGYGETQIKNRCKNGVDCSELEHELNRRTEFKFTK